MVLLLTRLQVHHKRFIRAPGSGGCPLTSPRAGRRAGGLQAPDWQPKEVRQGCGAIKGLCQELFMDQVLLLTVGVSARARDIVKVFPEENNKIESSSIVLHMLSGLI